MRIGIYHSHAGRRHAGGKAVFVREIAAHLADDHDVYLYTSFDDPPEAVATLADAGVTPVRVPPVRSRFVGTFVEHATPLRPDPVLPLLNAVREGVPDHVDAHVDVLLTHRCLEDVVLSNLVEIPVVYQYHNVQSVGPVATVRERLSGATGHLANSGAVARQVEEKLGRRVDGVVTPGVDTSRFSPDATPAFDTDRPVVLFVGRVVSGKGVFDLLDAVARMDAEPCCRLVGDGDLGAVEARARDLGLADSVCVAGEVDHGELPGYYAAATVCCNPSHYEGFGMANLEAMASGTPLVATRHPGVHEYADADSAVLVDAGDVDGLAAALDGLLAEADRRDRLGRRARERATEYSWAGRAEELAAVCARLACG